MYYCISNSINLLFKNNKFNNIKHFNKNTLNTKLINTFTSKPNINYINNKKKLNTTRYNLLSIKSIKFNFKYLTINLFKMFFNNSNVDIPKVLLPFKTLSSPKNIINIFKFNNYLSTQGKNITSLLNLNTA